MFGHMFRALGHGDYRRYFIGQGISQIGSWMQQTVLSWLAWSQTGTAWALAMVVVCGQLPLLFIGPLAGVWADRYPQRPLLLVCQTLASVLAASLALLSLWRTPGIEVVLLAALILGVLNAVEIPLRQALIGSLWQIRDLQGNALALNSLSFNTARLLGPPLAGALFAQFGATLCFALNTLSYVPALYSLWRMPRLPAPAAHGPQVSLQQARRWIGQTPAARWLFISVAGSSLGLAPFMSLLPIYAQHVFGMGPAGLGQLLGASGLGALLATLLLASRSSHWPTEHFIGSGALVFGLSCLGFACNQRIELAWPLLVLVGASLVACVTASGILLQSLLPDALRGRVMALYSAAYIGCMPIGSLLTGAVATGLSVRSTFNLAGAGMLILGLILICKLLHVSIARVQFSSDSVSLK
ncbi:MFS transporter [Pseudomonas sp. Pseusp122]|uniref:MFS transporter n=1 Tax=unclassified Pseudomonas TaxID=196821 RepID=UPI0039A7584E